MRDAALSGTQRAYAERRAEAMRRGLRGRVRGCGTRGVEAKCGCGKRTVNYRCAKPLLCHTCASFRRWQNVRRIESAIRGTQSTVLGGKTLMLTLTARHGDGPGALEDLRNRLALGWRRFSLAVAERWGHTPYVGVWEVTPGRDGRGHLHMHVVVTWPWRDWSEVRRMWLDACPSSTRIDIRRSWQAREDGARAAAEYISKYIGKTRGRPDVNRKGAAWTPELMARVHAATYQLRWIFASKGLLPPRGQPCGVCGQRHEICRRAGDAWLSSPDRGGVWWEPLWDMPEWWEPWPFRLGPQGRLNFERVEELHAGTHHGTRGGRHRRR